MISVNAICVTLTDFVADRTAAELSCQGNLIQTKSGTTLYPLSNAIKPTIKGVIHTCHVIQDLNLN